MFRSHLDEEMLVRHASRLIGSFFVPGSFLSLSEMRERNKLTGLAASPREAVDAGTAVGADAAAAVQTRLRTNTWTVLIFDKVSSLL